MGGLEQIIIGNRYQFVEKIGEGGMGLVFKGTDMKTMQDIAIKVLKPQAATENPQRIERFRREAEAIRQIDHPNIVKVIDTLHERGMYYIIMPYMEAGSLKDILGKVKYLSYKRALEMALDITDALIRTHRVKIIHRDIKPANVLIDEDGITHLTDFGAVHMGSKSDITAPGSVIGTYFYMAPEVLRGDPFDQRSDIWSFGVMLYEMVTGVKPFMGINSQDLFRAIFKKDPYDPRKIRPDMPESLVKLIYGMLTKDPQKRIFSMRQVGAQLEDVQLEIE